MSKSNAKQVAIAVRALPNAIMLGWDIIIVTIVLVVWIGTTAYADDQDDQMVRMSNAADMIGKLVKDQEGNSLGRIQDLVFHWRSDGYTEYAVLSLGGLFGLREEYVAVPWEALTLNVRKDHFVLNMKKVQLKDLPEFVLYRFYDRSLAAVLGADRPAAASSAHVIMKNNIESAANVSGIRGFEVQSALEQEFSR